MREKICLKITVFDEENTQSVMEIEGYVSRRDLAILYDLPTVLRDREVGIVTTFPQDATKSSNGGDYYSGYVVRESKGAHCNPSCKWELLYNHLLFSDFEEQGERRIGWIHEGSIREVYEEESGACAPTSFEVRGYELVEKRVGACGNSGRAYTPADWIGHRVAVIRLD